MSVGQMTARLAGVVAVLTVAAVKTAPDGPAGADDGRDGLVTRTQAVVVDVVDGDTLRAQTPGGRDLGRVRLLGIDAPEVAHFPDPAECYGDTATRALTELAPVGSTLWLATDPTQDDRDVYGRMLRYVDHDGVDVAQELLEAGAARLYESDTDVTRARGYETAAAAARDAGRGLWGAC